MLDAHAMGDVQLSVRTSGQPGLVPVRGWGGSGSVLPRGWVGVEQRFEGRY